MITLELRTPEVADILRTHWDEYKATNPVSFQQIKAVNAILSCRTPLRGGYIEACDNCSYLRITYESCRNRHCPKCQYVRGLEWIEKRMQELLPVPYFHVVFTVPKCLRQIFRAHPKAAYDLLLECIQETLLEMAKDEDQLGAMIGGIIILHTWKQDMLDHPHGHCIVPGGGLSLDKTRWIASKSETFLLSIEALRDKFRGKLLANLKIIPEIGSDPAFKTAIKLAYNKKWVIYIKPPFSGPKSVLEYMSRYTHKIAISNHRIVAHDGVSVTFKYRDRSDNNKQKEMTIPALEFIRRFLLHVLPPRQIKIRYFGFMANRNKTALLAKIRQFLNVSTNFLTLLSWRELLQSKFASDLFKCPQCKTGTLVMTEGRIQPIPYIRGP